MVFVPKSVSVGISIGEVVTKHGDGKSRKDRVVFFSKWPFHGGSYQLVKWSVTPICKP